MDFDTLVRECLVKQQEGQTRSVVRGNGGPMLYRMHNRIPESWSVTVTQEVVSPTCPTVNVTAETPPPFNAEQILSSENSSPNGAGQGRGAAIARAMAERRPGDTPPPRPIGRAVGMCPQTGQRKHPFGRGIHFNRLQRSYRPPRPQVNMTSEDSYWD